MPKIIENLESKLIEEAKKQVEQSGYGALTIRSVAKACGVGCVELGLGHVGYKHEGVVHITCGPLAELTSCA